MSRTLTRILIPYPVACIPIATREGVEVEMPEGVFTSSQGQSDGESGRLDVSNYERKHHKSPGRLGPLCLPSRPTLDFLP